MITLRCHCRKRLADWAVPLGGEGGTLTLPCPRCGPTCPTCQGFPAFALRGPIRIVPEAGLRALWQTLTAGRAVV